ncbi:MAG: deoxyribonuclease IV [Armatimonadota bacterium]
MPARLLIGAHLSTSRGLDAMLHNAVDLGATCAQIFTSSPQQWRSKSYTPKEVEAFHAAQAETRVGPVVSHDSYLINLASTDPTILQKSQEAFHAEIDRCGQLGLPMVVMHLGAYKGGTEDEGLACLAASLNELIPQAEDLGVQIVLETTAGQGTYLGGYFAQFPRLFELIPRQGLLGICFDTCHAHVAGYDIRDPDHYRQVWEEFDQHIGLDRLRVIHLNDTDKALGSHADRHAPIGKGQLGMETFRLIMQDPRFIAVPKILETPGGDAMFAEELALLRGLAE